MRLITIFLLSLFSSSGTSPVVAAAPRTIDIIATDDMKYSVTSIAARPGEQIRVRVIARGAIPKVAMAHNFVLVKPGTDIPKFLSAGAPHRGTDFIAPEMQKSVLAQTPFAGPGEAVQVVFTVPAKPGRYTYLCTFAGHYPGMQGTLIVK